MLQPPCTACTIGLCKALPNTHLFSNRDVHSLLFISHSLLPSADQGRGTRHRPLLPAHLWQCTEMSDPWGQRAPEGPQPGCHCRTHPKAGFSTSAFRQGLWRKTHPDFPLRRPLRRVLGTLPSLSPPVFWWAALTLAAISELPFKSYSSIISYCHNRSRGLSSQVVSRCFPPVFLSPWHLCTPPGTIHTASLSLINVNTSQCEKLNTKKGLWLRCAVTF